MHSPSSFNFEFLRWLFQDSFCCYHIISFVLSNPTGGSWRLSQALCYTPLVLFKKNKLHAKSIAFHQFNLMKDKHTINLILISSKWVIPSFGVCSSWINSSSKCFHLFFPEFEFPRSSCWNLHWNHHKALILFLSSFNSISSSFCHRSSSWWFFMI